MFSASGIEEVFGREYISLFSPAAIAKPAGRDRAGGFCNGYSIIPSRFFCLFYPWRLRRISSDFYQA